jgi:hypothetical protein
MGIVKAILLRCLGRGCDTLMTDEEQDKLLLDRLHAHGQQFLSSFSLPATKHKKRKRLEESDASSKKVTKIEDEEEEWLGFGDKDVGASNEREGSAEGITQLKIQVIYLTTYRLGFRRR